MRNNKGQGLVEYVLVLVLMGLLTVGAIRSLGAKTHNAFYQAGQTMDASTTKASGDGNSTGQISTD